MFIFTPEICKASRTLLGISQKELASKANVATSTVADFERGTRSLLKNNEELIMDTLKSLGIIFHHNGDIGFALTLAFLTLNKNFELSFNLNSDTLGILNLFGTTADNKITLSVIQQATIDMKKSLEEIVNKINQKAPRLNALKKAIKDLKDDEYFLLLPKSPSSTRERFEYEMILNKLNNVITTRNFEDSYSLTTEIFGEVMDKYDIHSIETDQKNRLSIGNNRKADRICRFCHRTQKDGATFRKVAHAIPSALGNQLVKLNDECDSCNEYFGQCIEPHLIEMLNIQRAFLGTTSRGKYPELKFSNGKIVNYEDSLVIISQDIQKDENDIIVCGLTSTFSLVPVKAYKTLAKIALSVIPEKYLHLLERTVKWVRNDTDDKVRLPQIATNIIYFPQTKSAQITLYIRKDNSSILPHVICEFRLGCFIYVYALPFSENDSHDLDGFFEKDEFKKVFKHYNSIGGWKLQDLNSKESQKTQFKINVKKKI